MYVKNQKFLVIGASKSGFAVMKYLLDNNADCSVYEQLKTQKASIALEKLNQLGVQNITYSEAEELVKEIDVLILSPGVPINHELAVKAKQYGKRIMGELEFAFLINVPPIIAVTGTNGKTTTVTLIDNVLDKAGYDRQLVGNIGVPMTSKIDQITPNTVCVCEVSSFQLESVGAFCPHISCVLNIAPDHLERHYTMENYIFLKKRIFKNQRESEYCVLNFDDPTVKNFYSEVRAKVVWVSVKEKVDGAYLLDGKLYYYDQYIIDENSLKIKGLHNVYDALFVIAVCKLMGVQDEYITKTLNEFKGISHRIELVCEKGGVEFYNDSKATNTASTLCALETISKPTILILGGSEKGENYDALFNKIKERPVKHTVITGASRFNMLDSAGRCGLSEITVTENFVFAVRIASMLAVEGDAVLFSPACASYDKFSGFEERGLAYVKAVKEL